MQQLIEHVCRKFRISGVLKQIDEIKVGNINKTYKLTFLRDDGKTKYYILQKVNTNVFKDPVGVMDNIDAVTEYLHKKNPKKTALHFHHTADRKTYVDDETGFWRLFNYIPSITYNVTDNMKIVRNAGAAFGEFQQMLSDFDASTLSETIEGFHDTKARFRKLWQTVTEDKLGRCAELKEELDWLREVEETACSLVDRYEKGLLPLRVTHNDPKINNALFDAETDEALVVIDLDTVMPGLVGNDFGDAIRFAANYVMEDDPAIDQVGVNMPVFEAFADGFLKYTASALTEEEINTLALSCFTLTTELAVRFADDYIAGDPYFKINYPEHNLIRTKNQVAMGKDILRRMPEMEAIVKEKAAQYK